MKKRKPLSSTDLSSTILVLGMPEGDAVERAIASGSCTAGMSGELGERAEANHSLNRGSGVDGRCEERRRGAEYWLCEVTWTLAEVSAGAEAEVVLGDWSETVKVGLELGGIEEEA